MRPSWKILVTVAAMLLAAPQLALADQVEDQLQQMQDRMTDLENKLQATNDELETSKERVDQQQELIKKAGIDEARGAGSGSPALDFINSIEFDGFAAVSYNWNFNMLGDEDVAQQTHVGNDDDDYFAPSTVGGENGGVFGLVAPGHTNSNSFQLDQLWLGFGTPATMERNAGFRADIVYGANADANREGTFFTVDDDDATNDFDDDGEGGSDFGTGDLPHVFQAYVEYLLPVGENGISFKAGRMATIIGAESFRQDQNYQITRGINWALQPVNHTGLYASGKCSSCNLDWTIGVVNSYSDTMSDRDNEKGVIGGLKWSNETFSIAQNVFYGGDAGDWTPWATITDFGASGINRSGDKIGVADTVITWNPTDRFSAWANYDYYWVHNQDDQLSGLDIHAISLASRYGITEATGVSLRGEYQWWDSSGDFGSDGAKPQIQFWALTGTVDHKLAENLTIKAEVRYDVGKLRNDSDGFFLDGGDGPSEFDDNDQVLGLVQMRYDF